MFRWGGGYGREESPEDIDDNEVALEPFEETSHPDISEPTENPRPIRQSRRQVKARKIFSYDAVGGLPVLVDLPSGCR